MTSPFNIRARVRVKVRRGSPSRAAPELPIVERGTILEALQTVAGERVSGEDRWYALSDNRFAWAGAFDPITPANESGIAADPNADRPNSNELGDHVPPVFETVAGVSHPAQGRRPHGLEGLIVHFDAYRIKRAGNGAEDSDRRTIEMIGAGRRNGYHYVEISRTGKIFVPDGFEWEEWGSHAGTSLCPATGRIGVSQFYVGVEMNNPGMLYPTSDPNVLVPWYNANRTSAGVVIVDGQGRATRTSSSDEWYSPGEARRAPASDNIKAGWYLPYSHDQFEALTNLALHLAGRFSAFSLDRVLGHDEVAPNRKNDPGGALANPDEMMTMKQYRDYLKARA